jgi:hypothetical protein
MALLLSLLTQIWYNLWVKNAFEIAVIKTLTYADLFDQALTLGELKRWLVGYRLKDGDDLAKSLHEVRSTKYIVRYDLWVLKGRADLLDLKLQQQQIVEQKLKVARRWLWLFRLVPWVMLVAVTGSVAGGSPGIEDDIDFIVVTVKNRMWLSRFLLTGLLTLVGKRRKPTDDPIKVNNKLCLNMWVSKDHLASDHQDLYVANELAHMVPLVNRDKMYERYVLANEWTKEILPNFFYSFKRPISSGCLSGKPVQKSKPHYLAISLPSILDWLDSGLEKWQMRRMRPRTKETVKDGLLMFHPKDYRKEILAKYEKSLKDLKV